MSRCIALFVLAALSAFAQPLTDDGLPYYESLALSGNGADLVFTSTLLLRGEEGLSISTHRMYRYASSLPVIDSPALNDERFFGAYLSTDSKIRAQYCQKPDGGFRPVYYEGLCLTRDGQRTFIQGRFLRLSRNGRFLWDASAPSSLRDFDTGERYPLPSLTQLHLQNALSDNGTAVTYYLDPKTGLQNNHTAALLRPDAPQRLLYDGDPVAMAAISSDARYVFLRADSPDGASSLIEIEVETGVRRTVFQTTNDRFAFTLDSDASHVMIRYFQAISIWDRATGTVRRLVDSPDLIRSAVLSDDGTTVVAQRNNGAILRVNTATAQTEQLYGPTPTLLSPRGRTAYPGSAVFFATRGFLPETTITIDTQQPFLIRLSDTSIQEQELVLQIPWTFPVPPIMAVVTVANPGSPFLFKSSLAFSQQPVAAFFNTFDSASQSFVLSAALQDFSALVTSTNPAPAGSTIHAYLGALGPLDRPMQTGQPGPANPPAKPLAALTCEIRIDAPGTLFRALEILDLTYAPGLVGVYQADLKIPLGWPTAYNILRCRADGRAYDETRLFTRN